MSKILFVAAHPDDETLGCGGTIYKHKSQNDEIHWLIITNVDKENGWDDRFVKTRQIEIDKIKKHYGFNSVHKLDFPTTKLDTIPMGLIISKISKIISKLEPEIVYTNHHNDVHTDHQIVFSAISSCTKSFRYPFIKKILSYETLSETEFSLKRGDDSFNPNLFVDISAFIEQKCAAMKIYKSEVMEEPFPRSIQNIKALAKLRGSSIGKDFAEAFIILKEIS